jgi:hypothetical protein
MKIKLVLAIALFYILALGFTCWSRPINLQTGKIQQGNFNKDIKAVTLLDIKRNPAKFADKLVLIKAVNRGWGRPVNAKEIWGKMVTRSDFVFEDKSGAAYISGTGDIKKGEEVSLLCYVKIRNDSWALFKYKVLQTNNSAAVNDGKNLKAVINGNIQFGWEMYQELSKEYKGKNIFFSPFLIKIY